MAFLVWMVIWLLLIKLVDIAEQYDLALMVDDAHGEGGIRGTWKRCSQPFSAGRACRY